MPLFASNWPFAAGANCPSRIPCAMRLQPGRFEFIPIHRISVEVVLPGSGTAIVITKPFFREVSVITGDEIRLLRGQDSQAEFAHRLGVSASTVCRWETGDTRPSPLALRNLLKLRKRAAALAAAERM